MRITSSPPTDIRFPWIAAVAPVVVACILWAVTGSPMSLIFGAMSPVMVVAHFVDGRRATRRREARESHVAENDEAERVRAREIERQAAIDLAVAAYPAASKLSALVDVARRPTDVTSDAPRIRLGVTLDGQPFVIAPRDGVVIEGAAEVTRDVKRAVTAQAWWSRMSIWDCDDVITSRAGTGRWLITVTAGEGSVWDRDAPAQRPVAIRPDRMTAHELASLRSRLVEHSRRGRVYTPRENGIGVVVGATTDGEEVRLDLARHGPHAVVSGMTGSGKTTFIVNWLCALAERFTPDELEFAVIDFKGGLDFTAVADVAHCVGIATDTEDGSVDRALVALDVELRRREESLTRGEPVGRLVVVLDEFRATAAAHPLAVTTVVDLTARGRALGVHVILCTQRAASTISEDILANVPLRIAFRSLSAAESRFVVGSDVAHTSLRDVGDAIVAGLHDEPVKVRMRATEIDKPHTTPPPDAPDALDASDAPRASASRRRLWAPPLPRRITVPEAREHARPADNQRGACIGVVDVPARQSWRAAWYDAHVDGHLMITGTAASGRTNALRTVTAGCQARWLGDGVSLWDELDTRSVGRSDGKMIVVDALEARLAELAPEFRDVLVERLTLSLRQPQDCRFVVSCDADGAWALRLGGLFPHRLHLSAGSAIPGRARWRGHDLQVALGDALENAGTVTPTNPRSDGDTSHRAIVVTQAMGMTRDEYLAQFARHGIEVIHAASPGEWMRDPAQFLSMCAEHALVIAGDVHSADLRLLLRHLAPVPPVRPGESLVFEPDGRYRRVL